MVSFSCYQKADYSEWINNNLKGIPIESMDDFSEVSKSLESLLNKKIVFWVDNDDLRERIESIRELIDHPENYVQNEVLFPEFRRLIKGKIRDKIEEFAAFTLVEKQSYILDQKRIKDKAKENQQMVKELAEKHKNREPSVVSDQQWLQLMQDRFNQEIGGVNINNFDLITRNFLITSRDQIELLLSTGISIQTLINHPARDLFVFYSPIIISFRARGVEWPTFLEPGLRGVLFSDGVSIIRLIDKGVTWPTIMGLPENLRNLVLQNAYGIRNLIENTDVTWQDLMELPEGLLSKVIQNTYGIRDLIGNIDVTWQDLMELPEGLLSKVIQNVGLIRRLNRRGYSWHDIRKMFYLHYRVKQAIRNVFDFIVEGIFTG